MKLRLRNIIFNGCILLNSLLLFLLLFGAGMEVPPLLQVVGRMHPLILHFPIVLLVIAFIWELVVPKDDHPFLKDTGNWLLLGSAFTASVAALMGLFLSKEDGFDEDTISLHKWTGVAISFIAISWYVLRQPIRSHRWLILSVGLVSMAGLVMAGHQGANITHGENFLLAPVTTPQTPDVLLEDAIAYTHLIQPILESKCYNCHNSAKAKGQLVMETEALLLKGGKNGMLWDTTAANMGLMIERLHLPETVKEHMPPKGKPQLTAEEMDALYYWIKGGASFTQKIADLPKEDTLRLIAANFFKTVENDVYDFEAADNNLVKELHTDYRVINPLSIQSPALSVAFFGSTFYNGQQLSELDKLKNNIVVLNLNKMPVTDADLKHISTFKKLRKLNLSFTNITGASLHELKALDDLRQLSLSGTTVKATHLNALKGLNKLATVYIWNTGISESDLSLLQKNFPHTRFESGFKGDTIISKLNAPIIEADAQIFSGTTQVKLKHYLKGVQMRYTTDGTEPDSLTSAVYKAPITLMQPGALKVKAFLPGWISSDISTKSFYKSGYTPDSVQLLTQPATDYKGKGALTLTDLEKGDLNFRDGKWLGYKDAEMKALFYFDQPVELSHISISTIVDISSYIMPAQQLEVWGGTNASNLQLLKRLNPKQPTATEPSYLVGFDLSFAPKKVSVLKIVAKPVAKLPAWHPGKGQRGWVFIDEVFIN